MIPCDCSCCWCSLPGYPRGPQYWACHTMFVTPDPPPWAMAAAMGDGRRPRRRLRPVALVQAARRRREEAAIVMSYLPGALRACDQPDCRATYEALTGPLGQTPERCWRLHPAFSMHLCPDHSPLWGGGDGPHVPRLDHATRAASCSCGEALPGATLGQMSDAYRRHLQIISPPERPDAE